MNRGAAEPSRRPPEETTERLLLATDVAEILAVPVTWVREATRDGRLPHLRLGRYVRYERMAVFEWLTEQRAGGIRGGRRSGTGLRAGYVPGNPSVVAGTLSSARKRGGGR